MAEDIKALARRAYEQINAGDTDGFIDLLTDDFVEHEEFPGLEGGKEGVRQFFTIMRTAFPDFRFEILHMIAEGDMVAAHLVMRGTHEGEFLGMPRTGKQISVRAVDIVRFENGRAAEHWGVTDTGAMMQQLGAAAGATAGAPA